MKAAIYARGSTSDKKQELETQLLPLRDFVEAQGWDTFRTYVDMTPGNGRIITLPCSGKTLKTGQAN